MTLTLEDVNKLKPGRGLDGYIAQYVYGYQAKELEEPVDGYTHEIVDGNGKHLAYFHKRDLGGLLKVERICPIYSVSMRHAAEIIQLLRLSLDPDFPNEGDWECHCSVFNRWEGDDYVNNATYSTARTIPHAVCLTALKVMILRGQHDRERTDS
jgi:hypothetical protein